MDEDDEAKEAARFLPPRLHFTITTIFFDDDDINPGRPRRLDWVVST